MFSSGDVPNPMTRVSTDELDPVSLFDIGDLEHNLGFGNGFLSQGPDPFPEFVDLAQVNCGVDIVGGESAAQISASPAEISVGSPEVYPDIALSFINQILMEEDLVDQVYMPLEDPALIAAEKTFYDVLDDYKNSHDRSVPYADIESGDFSSFNREISGNMVVDNSWVYDLSGSHYSHIQSASVDYASPDSFDSVSNTVGGMNGNQLNTCMPGMCVESLPIYQFHKGLQDANKFLPDNRQAIFDMQSNNFLPSRDLALDGKLTEARDGEEQSTSSDGRGRKNSRSNDMDFDGGRSSKLSATSCADTLSNLFEEMLHLCIDANGCGEGDVARRNSKKQVNRNAKNAASKKSSGGKSQSKVHGTTEVVDLGTLLLQCAQAVASCDRRSVNEQLQVIRQNASFTGDGSQRVAHYFADGLEARFAGIGSQIYQSRLAKRSVSTSEILKAYHLYMGVSPFKRISHFYANQSILSVANKADKIHIIDFGIGFGFQWPCLFRRLSRRKNGCPKVRITGIDLPQPGFRPRERLEETGRRLAECAQSFNIAFEYHAIASRWENIKVGDLNIEDGEVLIANCLYMLRNLADETVIVESPRSIVLKNIREMNPDLFVTGVMSSACGSPFFITRFREALFYYSALFDVLESVVPREDPCRLLIEREIFGREAMNIIACEGSDRVYRPETYKQWRGRIQQAGFKQLPRNPDILKIARHSVLSCYDKNFIVEEDNEWMLLGWKGRVLYALSTWEPVRSGA